MHGALPTRRPAAHSVACCTCMDFSFVQLRTTCTKFRSSRALGSREAAWHSNSRGQWTPSQTSNPRMHGSRGVVLGVRRRLLHDVVHRPVHLLVGPDTDLFYSILFRVFFLIKLLLLDSNGD
jgi:hypothetical protein